MPVQLPTDTMYLRFETRQYELFNRPLGQGIVRRKLAVGAVAAALWSATLLLIGVDPISTTGPMLYIAPVAGLVVAGTRTDDSGRMRLIGWYDWFLSRMPARRRVIGNPLLGASGGRPVPMEVEVTVEVHPVRLADSLTPLLSRAGRRMMSTTTGELHAG
jgi:hypothetical protein